ncbi:hypothetical protein HispidOSU_013369 [Sigmodon hispidus]
MDKEPPTLLDLAVQFLLKNEPIGIQGLQEIPRELFLPLFAAAFKGRHKNMLTAMVKVWPFVCLHIGSLSTQESQSEILVTIIESFQVLPVQNSASRSPKLRILDLRQDASSCKITCPEFCVKTTVCLHSCADSEHSIMQVEAQGSSASLEPEVQPSKHAMELIVNLSLDGTLRERQFLNLLLNKVEQSSGCLHLCCRDLQIYKLCDHRNVLHHLDLKCINHLAVEQASLRDVNTLLAQVVHMNRLCLSRITCRSLNGRTFRNFTSQLSRMDHLNELNLSSFCLTDHLQNVLRVLPTSLEYLHLPFCGLSYRDFKYLSECPQVSRLLLLNINNNPMYWEDCGFFYLLLQNISTTLKHLEINHCLLTDSTIYVLMPALSHCSQLQVLSFCSNPISMPMLMRILEHLTSLMQLKCVIYPIPVHCYGRWHFHGSLDHQKLAEVQLQLIQMLREAERSDMYWITFSE